MADLFTEFDAGISCCGTYRYWLTRRWHSLPLLPIVMLNPSTADASVNDPTIRRCMSFAAREAFGGIKVMNLFAYRATSPDDMKASRDPIGPECSKHIEKLLADATATETPVLVAWGAHGDFMQRAEMFCLSAKGHGAHLVCLGTTKEGHPRHPLYVRGDQTFQPFYYR